MWGIFVSGCAKATLYSERDGRLSKYGKTNHVHYTLHLIKVITEIEALSSKLQISS
ncbi:MAG TPA: hypothetical protein PJ989_07070 [Oligoflexia bacterium]|nr:hypothetical protein [Oligoflexia bacterium]